MGKKGKKDKKGKGAEKTAAKTEKNMEKKKKKLLKETGEEDIESLIAEFKEQDKKRNEVQEEKCGPPSPRCNMTFVPHPMKDELIMFGGEYFNGNKTFMYNDLFHYNIKNDEWALVKVPNAPPPRCSHQMVALRQGGGQLWMFGGEFASPSQNQFYHYKDLWVYHINDKRWEIVKAPGGPSARSGHRMVSYKKMLLVFGGFHDNSREYKYYNDVHAFSLETYAWTKLAISGSVPHPRSGHVMAVTENGQQILIYGGYSKEKVKRDVDKGKMHTDMFSLTLDSKKSDENSQIWKWQSVKQSGNRPSERCGCTLVATPGNRAVVFGGVFDEEEDDENVKGKFFNDMYSLELDKGKWHEVFLRGKRDGKERKRRRKAKPEGAEGDDAEDDSEEDEDDIEEEVIKKLKVEEEELTSIEEASSAPAIETSAGESVFTVTVAGPSATPDKQSANGDSKPEAIFVPHPRMNPILCVKNGILFLFGGLYEDGDKQLTLQDFYSLDLHKLEEWNTIISSDLLSMEWLGSDSSAGEDSDSDEDMDIEAPAIEKGEEFTTYFDRTIAFWIEQAEEMAEEEGLAVSEKQMKKAAKNIAKEFYEEET